MQIFPPSSRKGQGWVWIAATIAFTSVIASTALVAQESRAALDPDATLRVLDVNGVPIPNVTVALNGGSTRVTDKAGVVNVKAAPRDSLRVLVRRMGYKALEDRVGRNSITGSYAVTLTPTSQSLKTVKVEGRQYKSSLDLRDSTIAFRKCSAPCGPAVVVDTSVSI